MKLVKWARGFYNINPCLARGLFGNFIKVKRILGILCLRPHQLIEQRKRNTKRECRHESDVLVDRLQEGCFSGGTRDQREGRDEPARFRSFSSSCEVRREEEEIGPIEAMRAATEKQARRRRSLVDGSRRESARRGGQKKGRGGDSQQRPFGLLRGKGTCERWGCCLDGSPQHHHCGWFMTGDEETGRKTRKKGNDSSSGVCSWLKSKEKKKRNNKLLWCLHEEAGRKKKLIIVHV
ncbi:unnamed protein product [Lactuca saligna]|uniref:Uncharacterized protein n=1 Tax=Lactuca saligna TaxID=75948 RepID=A0AA35ZIL8_LACSI|nr:unnamed protein product [Lactuca saligna]